MDNREPTYEEVLKKMVDEMSEIITRHQIQGYITFREALALKRKLIKAFYKK